MRRIGLFFAAFTLFLSASSAFANFSGAWSGSGSFTSGNGHESVCDEMYYEIRHSPILLTIKFGYISCPPYQTTLRPFAFTIHGDYLVFQGSSVGTLRDGIIHIEMRTGEVIDAALKDEILSFREELIGPMGNRLWLLQGELRKQ